MNRALWKLIKDFLCCLLAVICLAAAGSDGDYFPWVNIVGTLVLVIMAMVHLRHRQRGDILTRAEQRQALRDAKDLNARLGRLNERMKHRGAATTRG